MKANSYISFKLVMDIKCHNNEQMKAIKSCVSIELDEELHVVFSEWTTNPIIILSPQLRACPPSEVPTKGKNDPFFEYSVRNCCRGESGQAS